MGGASTASALQLPAAMASNCLLLWLAAAPQKMIRLEMDRPFVVLLPVLLSKNLRKLHLTKQTRSSAITDKLHDAGLQSS